MKQKNLIATYRKLGYKIEVNHCRRWEKPLCGGYLTKHEMIDTIKPKNNGGMTVLNVTTPDGRDFSAYSICSESDNYSRQLGINLCMLRLQKQGCFIQ